MNNDNELDEILAALKQRRENENNNSDVENKRADTEPIEIEPPKKNIEPDNQIIDLQELSDKSLQEPKAEVILPDVEPPVKNENNKKDSDLVWFKKKENKKEKRQKKVKNKDKNKEKQPVKLNDFFAKIKNNYNNNFLPKLKSAAKRIFTKQMAIIVGTVVLVVALVIGGVKLYEYSKIAYLKPYEEKYNIEYPVGILEQFCDAYGENQNVAGAISISDTNTDKYFIKSHTADVPYLESNADITANQQNIAVSLKSSDADLESVYSTPDGFLNASQKIVFNTLFEKATYRVVNAFYTNTNADDDSGYIFPYNLCGTMNEKSFDDYADRIKSRRLYDTGYEMSKEDTFLTVSVDSDFMQNFRFVILCVKVDGKGDFEKSSTAIKNESAHYPQIWYDKNNKLNPYRFAAKWYPEVYVDIENEKTTQLSIEDFE